MEINVMNNDEIRDFCIKKDLKIFELQDKIDKAIEYIEKEELDINANEDYTNYSGCFKYIIEILKGKSND